MLAELIFTVYVNYCTVYRNGLKPWICNVNICVHQWQRTKQRVAKNFSMQKLTNGTEKTSCAGLVKDAWLDVLRINACAAVKHKIILSWPKNSKILACISSKVCFTDPVYISTTPIFDDFSNVYFCAILSAEKRHWWGWLLLKLR